MMGRAANPAAETLEAPQAGGERELSSLLRLFEESRTSGQGRTAFVHGPSGVGKTHLFSSLRQRLASQGVRVWVATGTHSQHTGSYGLLRQLVPELLSYLAETGVPVRVLSELQRRTLPLRGGQHAGGEDPALDLADAVAELCSLAGRSSPAFLLTDLEAADRASLELLRYVLASAHAPGAQAGGLFVLGYRDDVPLPTPLTQITTQVGGLSVALSGLDLDGIRAYLARREVAERLLDVTRGNPAVLEQVIRAAPENHPEDFFLQRVRRLGRPEQEAAAALAIAGNAQLAADVASVLIQVHGQAPLDLDARLRRLVDARLLSAQLQGTVERFSFAREADRETLYRSVPVEQRQPLHSAWSAQLRNNRGASEEIARHLLASGDESAARLAALAAGRALAERLAFDDAITFTLKALELTPPAERAALHAELSRLYRHVADYPSALRHVGLWRRSLPTDQKRLARAEAAQFLIAMGRLESAEKQLARVAGFEPRPSADDASARAWVDLAEVAFLRGAYDRALSLCATGLETLADRPELAIALRNTQGKVHLVRAAYAEAESAFALNAAQVNASVRDAAQARLNQGVVAHRRGDKRAAISHYRAALNDLDRKGQAHALSNLGSLYAESGDFEAAVDHLSRALSAFTRARRQKEVAHCSGNLARLYLFLGDFVRAEELVEHMRQVASTVGDPYLQASARLIGAELAETRGNPAEAGPEFQAAAAQFSQLASPRYAAEAALGESRTALAQGDRAAARMALASSILAEVCSTCSAVAVERERVAGELALTCGDLPEATRRLSHAKEMLLAEPDLEGPYRVYAQLARLRAAGGDASGAAADAARAARLVDELIARVPVHRREAFAKVPRRAQVLADAAEHEITPARVRRALDLDVERSALGNIALLGRCDSMIRVLKMLPPIARASTTVLIRGESGTGKELIAEAVHQGSSRAHMPLVKVNCAAMVEDLLMSELFGHERGAFTGAVRERKGRFELAEGGSLFLDEIGDVSPKMQVALLRVLQEREFERVGGTRTLRADVRVIAATNRNLEEMIARGQFRQDLYYRLKGVALELPPLRERGDDLSLLCSHFLAKIARERGEDPQTLSPDALELLQRYPFPGNVRELENVLSSGTLFAQGRVVTAESFEHLTELREPEARPAAVAAPIAAATPAPVAPAPTAASATTDAPIDYFDLVRRRDVSLKDLRQEIETQCISRALQEAKGNISEAARLLKMKRSRLSQIVNAESALRALAGADTGSDSVGAEEEGE